MADTTCDRVCRDIELRIVNMEFGAQSFITEQSVAQHYNVSRGTAREALQRLCHEKYLVSLPRRGYMVWQLTRQDFEEIRAIRFPLERLALQCIIDGCTDEQIKVLYEQSDEHTPGKRNADFHLCLARLSGNRHLVDVLDGLVHACARFAATVYAPADTPYLSHHDIIEALLRRDFAEAEKHLLTDLGL